MRQNYILLTAAKNEEAYIGQCIESVLRQTVRPQAWFIMDDGSSDQTARIAEEFTQKHSFIRLHSCGGDSKERNFGSKDRAINAAYRLARQLAFDFVAIQDADVVPERTDYYHAILAKFETHPHLGIAGGYIFERSKGEWRGRNANSIDSVAGAIQFFRRACFEQICGYTPMHYGGEDWLAQLDARMAGWEVLACAEYRVFHYRPTSSADGELWGAFRAGMMDASFGSHPVFELLKCARRFTGSPIAIAAMMRFSGYLWWNCRGWRPIIPPEKVAFLRKRQLAKICALGMQMKQRYSPPCNKPSA